MKNQYVGDVNDYLKYGILRALASQSCHDALVAWMLTPDDGSSDGKFRSYLEQPHQWRKFDSDLFDGLTAVGGHAEPCVDLIERSGLLPGASFYSEHVPDTRQPRAAWFSRLRQAATDVALVFLDPDNGIEVPAKPVGRKGSSRYVLWSELSDLWQLGNSLLIYQHFPREKRGAFSARMRSELFLKTGATTVHCLKTRGVLFLLACQPVHEDSLTAAARWIAESWAGQIEVSVAPAA